MSPLATSAEPKPPDDVVDSRQPTIVFVQERAPPHVLTYYQQDPWWVRLIAQWIETRRLHARPSGWTVGRLTQWAGAVAILVVVVLVKQKWF